MVAMSRDATAQQPSSKAVEEEVIRITKAQWAAEMQKNTADAMRHISNDYTEFNGDYATRLEGKDLATRIEEAGFKDSGSSSPRRWSTRRYRSTATLRS
jgi:hypothetical protein